LIPLFANGSVLGPDQPVILHLLEIEPAKGALDGVVMELVDCAYPLVKGIVATTDVNVAFKDVSYAVLVGGFPRKNGMMRADLLAKNSPIFIGQGKALNDHASRDVKVLVVANPANSNCLVAATNAPDLPKTSFTALTRLDQNRANGQIATKAACAVSEIDGTVIWGNHSASLYADTSATTIGGAPLDASYDAAWHADFLPTVQKRGAAVIKARGLSSALSAANASKDHMRDWALGTNGKTVSMAVWTDGSKYGVSEGLIYSLPVTCADGKYTVVDGIKLSDAAAAAVKANDEELQNERKAALGEQ
jgi:malate dehydrogenase